MRKMGPIAIDVDLFGETDVCKFVIFLDQREILCFHCHK